MGSPKDVKKAIGERLERARKARGVSQVKLGAAFGHADGTQISAWESGRVAPSAENLARIPKLLGVSGHWLLTDEGSMDARPSEAELALEEIREVLKRHQEAPATTAGRLVGGARAVKTATGDTGDGRRESSDGGAS